MDWLGVAALCVAAVAGLALTVRPQSRSAPVAGVVGLVGLWAALLLLAWRFVAVDLRLVEVAKLSRDELSWPLRLAGVWAGSAGSFLFWSTLTVSVMAISIGGSAFGRSAFGRIPVGRIAVGEAPLGWAPLGRAPFADEGPRPSRLWPVRILGLAMATTSLAAVFVTRPFDRLVEPAVRGVGLNPVLEHWAMVVHPPLLYTAQAAVLAAALVTGSRRAGTDRRWTLAATALLLCATLLGSWWAHDELGWGGFWAWDPVENTALAPLVALIASLHARSVAAAVRWRRIAAAAVLAGIAVTRSGLPSSVHAFASGGAIAPLFAAAATAVAISAALPRRPTGSELGWSPRRVAAAATSLSAGWILIVVGSAAAAAMWLGSREPVGAVDGAKLGSLLAPAGVAVLVGVLVYGLRRRQSAWSLLAHLGVVVFALGVIGSLFASSSTSGVRFGEPSEVNGHEVTLVDTTIDESRADTVRADVAATVDGRAVTASIVNYPDLDRTRARPGRLIDLTGETELVVTMLDGDKALVELRRNPGLPYVWLGGGLVALALLGSLAARGYPSPPSLDRRRSRLAANNDPSVDVSPEESPDLESPDLGSGSGRDLRSDVAPGLGADDEDEPVPSG